MLENPKLFFFKSRLSFLKVYTFIGVGIPGVKILSLMQNGNSFVTSSLKVLLGTLRR